MALADALGIVVAVDVAAALLVLVLVVCVRSAGSGEMQMTGLSSLGDFNLNLHSVLDGALRRLSQQQAAAGAAFGAA